MKYLFFSIGLFITVSSLYAQRNIQDSVFFECMSLKLTSQLQKIKPDSTTASEFYSFRFRFTKTGDYVLEKSLNMPETIYSAVQQSFKETLVQLPPLNPFEKDETFFLIPLLIDLSGLQKNNVGLEIKGLHNFMSYENKISKVPSYMLMRLILFQTVLHNSSDLFKKLYKKDKN